MLIDPTQNPQHNSDLILQTTNPRPIAWVVTENREGLINIAPYSLFTPLSFDPPTLIVSFRPKEDGGIKDSLQNIRQSKKCTICMVTTKTRAIMHQTSQEIPPNQSEAEKFHIQTQSIMAGYPPIISASPIAYFCSFSQAITLQGDNTIPIILTIDRVFVDEEIIQSHAPLHINFNGVGHIVADRYRE